MYTVTICPDGVDRDMTNALATELDLPEEHLHEANATTTSCMICMSGKDVVTLMYFTDDTLTWYVSNTISPYLALAKANFPHSHLNLTTNEEFSIFLPRMAE